MADTELPNVIKTVWGAQKISDCKTQKCAMMATAITGKDHAGA